MTFATAITYLPRFAALGQLATVRQRSWDKEGRYAAIELRAEKVGGETTVTRKLYRAVECEEALRALEALQTPIDVVGTPKALYFTFIVPGTAKVIPAPDKTVWWSMNEMRQAGGLVTFEGRRYRLCKEVRTIVPIVDTP